MPEVKQGPAEQLAELLPCLSTPRPNMLPTVACEAGRFGIECHNCRLRPALLKWYEDGVREAQREMLTEAAGHADDVATLIRDARSALDAKP